MIQQWELTYRTVNYEYPTEIQSTSLHASTCIFMKIQVKALSTVGEPPEWEDPHLQNSKTI